MFLHLSVSHSVHGGGGVCLLVRARVCLPLGPKGVSASGSKGGVCLWVLGTFGQTPGHPRIHTPGQTPPGHWSGRYASYWNAYFSLCSPYGWKSGRLALAWDAFLFHCICSWWEKRSKRKRFRWRDTTKLTGAKIFTSSSSGRDSKVLLLRKSGNYKCETLAVADSGFPRRQPKRWWYQPITLASFPPENCMKMKHLDRLEGDGHLWLPFISANVLHYNLCTNNTRFAVEKYVSGVQMGSMLCLERYFPPNYEQWLNVFILSRGDILGPAYQDFG